VLAEETLFSELAATPWPGADGMMSTLAGHVRSALYARWASGPGSNGRSTPKGGLMASSSGFLELMHAEAQQLREQLAAAADERAELERDLTARHEQEMLAREASYRQDLVSAARESSRAEQAALRAAAKASAMEMNAALAAAGREHGAALKAAHDAAAADAEAARRVHSAELRAARAEADTEAELQIMGAARENAREVERGVERELERRAAGTFDGGPRALCRRPLSLLWQGAGAGPERGVRGERARAARGHAGG
jgi:hypothetical protein